MSGLRKWRKPKKTDNVIYVLLGDEPDTLDIDNHEVHQNAIRQTIVWQLDKSLVAGNFLGFQWNDAPPIDTFDPPEISPDGNSLTIGDHHAGAKSKGDFGYTLTVEFGGHVYTSERKCEAEGVVKGPIIINR